MPLVRLDERNYIDVNSLISVQFEDSGSAKIQLSTGGNIVLDKAPAESLRAQLHIGSGTPESPEDQGTDGSFSLVSRKKGWFMLAENGIAYIVAAVNAKGSCSIRTFDGATGAFRGKQYRSGDFHESFPQLRIARELSVPYQPNLERDCRERLPDALLKHLQEQFG